MSRFKRGLIGLILLGLVCGGATPLAASARAGQTYVVQPGDTLYGIAVEHGISLNLLAAANDLELDDWVYVGQVLRIPGQAAPETPPPVELGPDPLVPDPLPALPALSPAGSGELLPYTYARVIQADAPVYEHPSDAPQGREPKRRLSAGFVWVSLHGQTTYEGRNYYRINWGEYVPAEALSLYQPSTFQGVTLIGQPARPFAWILQPVQPRVTPGGELNPQTDLYQRYDLVQIFATERLGEQVWYLIGPHQWINQIYVGKVTPFAGEVVPSALPEGVEPGVRWLEINLFEQTLAAYEGEHLVYATLISTGLPGWDTPQGLFPVWLRVQSGKMSGADGRPDYYFLEDVPWTLYFNGDVALHTAYWHDGFGYRHSHGCVNLAPADARWLYQWAGEELWVWVRAGG